MPLSAISNNYTVAMQAVLLVEQTTLSGEYDRLIFLINE
jgi:hypothetical protein